MLQEFEFSLVYMLENDGIKEAASPSGDKFIVGGNGRLNGLMTHLLWPFLNCLYRICVVLVNVSGYTVL